MFIEVGGGWHLNLSHVAKVHVVDQGGVGTVVKFYSASDQHLGDFSPSTPDELQRILQIIQSFGNPGKNL